MNVYLLAPGLIVCLLFGILAAILGNATLIGVTILGWRKKPWLLPEWRRLAISVFVNWAWLVWFRYSYSHPPVVGVFAFVFLAAIMLPVWAAVALEQKKFSYSNRPR